MIEKLKIILILPLLFVSIAATTDAYGHSLFNSAEETLGDYRVQIATQPEFPQIGERSQVLIRVTDQDGNEVDRFMMGNRIFYNDEQIITEFFLVPYFGACIHMPPPPPNQIIYVKYPKGLILEALYHPFWISGKLKTSLIENDMATAAYALDMEDYEPYSEE